jgi:hypothetical protein
MTQWGAYTGGSNPIRIGVDWAYSGNVLTAYVSAQPQYTYSGDVFNMAWSGGMGSGSQASAGTLNAGPGQVVSNVWQITFGAQPYNTTATITLTMSALYSGVTPTVTFNATLGPTLPAAATAFTRARVSDSRTDLAWTNNPTSSAPVDLNGVWRRDNLTAQQLISVAAGTATSYSDTSCVPDRAYEYLIAAGNNAGSTNTAWSAILYTTPAAPSACAAAKSGASDIAVSWTVNSTLAATQELWHAANGVWDGAALATPAAGVSTYTHVAPSSSVTHTYRVRAVSPTGGLQSAYVTSNVVTLATVPNPPVITGPVATPAAEATTVTWNYSSNDTADQTQYQLRYRLLGSGTWTTMTAVASSTKAATIGAGVLTNGNTYEAQVQVQGVPAMGWSAWSSTYTFVTSGRPSATITSTTPVKSSPINVAWTYFDPESAAQSGWEAQVTNAAGTVVLAAGSGFDQSTTWSPGLVIADGSTGKRRVRVRDGAGLWSTWVEQSYTATFDPPAVPTATISWDAVSGTATVTVAAGTGTGAPTVTLDVLRTDTQYGVTKTVTVATGLVSGQAIPDPDAPMTSTYVVRAVSAYPSYAYSLAYGLPTGVNTQYGYLSGGGRVARSLWNHRLDLDSSWDRDVFQADGRAYGIGVGTTARAATQGVQTDLYWDDGTTSSADDFVAVANGSLVCLWRDPTGRTLRGIVSDMRATSDQVGRAALSFSVRRVDDV